MAVHRLESLVGPADGVLVEALVRTDRSCQVPGVDEHVHGHELADDLTRRHLARRPVHLLGRLLRISGDLADRTRGVLPGLLRVLVSTQGFRLPTPDTGDHAPMILDHVRQQITCCPLLAGGLSPPLVRGHRLHRGAEAARHHPVTVLDVSHLSTRVHRISTAPKLPRPPGCC